MFILKTPLNAALVALALLFVSHNVEALPASNPGAGSGASGALNTQTTPFKFGVCG